MYWLGATVTPGMFRLAPMPNLAAVSFSAPPPRSMPSWPNVVSQDCENAHRIEVSPVAPALPHTSLLSLCSLLVVCGSVRICGECTMVLVLRVASCANHAELVTILKVEPGGKVVWVALLSSGLGLWRRSCRSYAFSALPLWTASLFGS